MNNKKVRHIKLLAFMTAFALFVCTVVISGSVSKKIIMGYDSLGTISSDARYKSEEILEETLDEKTMLMFGSSEFQHGDEMIYHPANTFRGTDMKPVFIGKFGYQSLTHTITLAAVADKIPNKKVVLVLSPSWFVEEGISSNAFASNFPEDAYIDMLKNEKLSEDTKNYIKKRAHTLLSVDKSTDRRIKKYENSSIKHVNLLNMLDKINGSMYEAFLKQKQNITLASNIELLKNEKTEKSQILKKSEQEMEKVNKNNNGIPDFEYLNRKAEDEIKSIENSEDKNEFNMTAKGYNRIKKRMKKSKNMFSNTENLYADSVEEKDLIYFLKVCRELDIEPLLVVLPVNGFWYEYMGSDKDSRNMFYQSARNIAKENGAELLDLSGYEYEPYFLEDNVHLFGKGWNRFNEGVYKFYKKN